MDNVYIAQSAIIFNKEGKFLSLRRSGTDTHRPLTWDLPGGKIERHENLPQALEREVLEEAGMQLEDVKLHHAIGRPNELGEYWLSIAYTAKPVSEKVVLSHEHDQYKWVTKEEFLALPSSSRLHEYIKLL